MVDERADRTMNVETMVFNVRSFGRQRSSRQQKRVVWLPTTGSRSCLATSFDRGMSVVTHQKSLLRHD